MNKKKIVCPCYKITKGDIICALEQGACCFKDVKKCTKVGTACGKCKDKAKKFTKKMIDRQLEAGDSVFVCPLEEKDN